MKNLYDIRNEKNLVYVLPADKQLSDLSMDKSLRVKVIVHLHYLDTVSLWAGYLDNVPDSIKVCVYSSDDQVLERAQELVHRKNIVFSKKENRGRDVSTLLVAARKEIENSDYFCFVHDKKEKHAFSMLDISHWISGMWENLLASECYIKNIINLFYQNEDIGLMTTPEPLGDYVDIWIRGTWYKNYEMTKNLAHDLDLKADIDADKQVVGCGTSFWAKTDALRKLICHKWKYEDFPEEPMEHDGTFGHAVERILGYVSQDAGYDVATIMTDHYISEYYPKYQEYAQKMFALLERKNENLDAFRIIHHDEIISKVLKFVQQNGYCYIYGAGAYGKEIFAMLTEHNFMPKGFVVSDGYREEKTYMGLPVYELSEVRKMSCNEPIIVAMYYSKQSVIEMTLKSKEMTNYIFPFKV